MAVAIQLIGAGLLLAAWIWLLIGPMRREHESVADWAEPADGTGDQHEMWSHWTDGRIGAPIRWWHRPMATRRRQLMLGTVFAAFASFLLAIALQGVFVRLFGLMAAFFVVHVAVAAYQGSKIIAARRESAIADAKAMVTARVSFDDKLTEPAAERTTETVTLHGPDADTESVGVSTVVSDLIDEVWRDESEQSPPSTPAVEPTVEPAAAPTPERQDPIFVRAAKDEPPRRRKARPLHIEAQLDNDGKTTDGTPPRAVNDI